MSRELKEDFTKLKDFIGSYNLDSLLKDGTYIELLSHMHKKYYSLMALVFELDKMTNKTDKKIINGKQREYYFENISDIGNSLFLTINGAYKPARLILRSSIETFLKGISIDELSTIDKEKRLYKMFKDIGNLTFFKNDDTKSEFDEIVESYSELSKDTHTATKERMQHTSSLNYFPKKSNDEIRKIANIFAKLVSSYLFLLSIKHNTEFHSIHHKNRNVILIGIKKKYRPVVQNIK